MGFVKNVGGLFKEDKFTCIGENTVIGKLLTEGQAKLQESRLGQFLGGGAETSNVIRINRQYIDSLTIEIRALDAVTASTEMNLFGKNFATPIMTGALSGIGGICPNPMVEIAKGILAAGAINWVGIGESDELKSIIETGVPTVKITKPYKNQDLIFSKLADAEKFGAFAVGMDVCSIFGGQRGDHVFGADIMEPKSLADIRSFIQVTKLPFILKGILSAKDAAKAVETGASAIVVSTHGGYVLDYAVPPLKVLPCIAKVVQGKIPIFVDSGICRGTDVFKTLALGADGVLIGRALLAGLAIDGAKGVQKVISGMNDELHRVMSLTGCKTLKEITPDMIWS
jgi:4-hydroxymandelate oxidase